MPAGAPARRPSPTSTGGSCSCCRRPGVWRLAAARGGAGRGARGRDPGRVPARARVRVHLRVNGDAPAESRSQRGRRGATCCRRRGADRVARPGGERGAGDDRRCRAPPRRRRRRTARCWRAPIRPRRSCAWTGSRCAIRWTGGCPGSCRCRCSTRPGPHLGTGDAADGESGRAGVDLFTSTGRAPAGAAPAGRGRGGRARRGEVLGARDARGAGYPPACCWPGCRGGRRAAGCAAI